ncbi:MAG: UDP-3-O-(3-hydroxymyristoyl)glucosamine N-acyltransferase [Deltaproteobacteria bacterium]|nr:UDP-3-O-(3-hydroxymyristoyl)glucosamine N-acyltransferase [Deltaproteobacteria bacterium]
MVLTLREIAAEIDGKVIGNDHTQISGINSLEGASEGEISFYYDRRYRDIVKETRASALIVSKACDLFDGPQIIVPNPVLACARAAGLFASKSLGFTGISSQAVVHESARIGDHVAIGPYVYVGENTALGDGTTLYPGVFIGDRVQIGIKTIIYPNVTILNDCTIGNEVIIHPGAVIGSDGFGFVRDGNANVKIPQIGTVQIDDHVEIGANNTIDRAAVGKTWIKRGVKTDNLVQVAHNVVIGEDTVIVAQTGISGSVRIGRQVVIGGQVGIADHLNIGDRVMIGSQSGVAKSLESGEVVSGTPTMPHRLWLKTRGLIARLPRFHDRLRHLEKRVKALENTE